MNLEISNGVMNNDRLAVDSILNKLFEKNRLINYFKRNENSIFEPDGSFEIISIDKRHVVLAVKEKLTSTNLQLKYLTIFYNFNTMELDVDADHFIRVAPIKDLETSLNRLDMNERAINERDSKVVFNSYEQINFDHNMYFTKSYSLEKDSVGYDVMTHVTGYFEKIS